MSDMFKVDFIQLERLKKAYKQYPKEFARASCNVLNSQAFYMKQHTIPTELDRTMTIRSKAFVNSSIRYDKARPRTDISSQQAIVGSIFRDRFTGWQEQQLGTKSDRKHVPTTMARGGSWSKTQVQSRRLKPTNTLRKRPNNQSIPQFLQIMSKMYKGEMFYLDQDYKKMEKGIYIIIKDKIHKIHDLSPKTTQPKPDHWMTRAIKAMDGYNLKDEWDYQMDKIFR